MAPSSEIKGDWKASLIGKIIGWVIRLMGLTYAKSYEDHAGITELDHDRPIVLLMWHNRIFSGPPLWGNKCRHRKMVALTSASKDGAILEGAIGVLGVDAARGSSSRRGAAALVTLRKALKAGMDTCITPDGPRGPIYELQPGALKLAQVAEVDIVIQHIETEDYWELNSWDKLRITKPFSKVKIIWDEPIAVPKDLTEEEFEALRLKIQEQMKKYNN